MACFRGCQKLCYVSSQYFSSGNAKATNHNEYKVTSLVVGIYSFYLPTTYLQSKLYYKVYCNSTQHFGARGCINKAAELYTALDCLWFGAETLSETDDEGRLVINRCYY
jgi:hypothetical protein